jgi:hypothetical protein
MDAPQDRITIVDGLLFVALTVAAAQVWGECAPASEVAGDSFVALQCGRRFLLDGWAVPSQNIFGWGLCATFAPLFAGAESIAEVASRRAFLASLVVPCAFVTTRFVLPTATRLSPSAVRVGSLCAAVAVLFAPGVGRPSSSGGHGYLSWMWIALCVAAFAVAAREPGNATTLGPRLAGRATRVLATALGVGSVAMAAMNHPFAIWIAVSAVILLPLGFARAGVVAILAGMAVGWLLGKPRLEALRSKMDGGDSFDSFAHQPDITGVLDPSVLSEWLIGGPDAVLLAGFFALLVLAFPLSRGDRARVAVAASWASAAVAGVVALVLLGRRVGYLQDYHLMTAHPFAALGVGMAAGAAFDGIFLMARGRLPRAAGPVLAALMAFAIAETSDLDEEGRSWRTPWCGVDPADGGKAGGVAVYRAAILEDLRGPDAPERFLITDLNLSDRRVDGSVVLGLSLNLAGVPAERMACCSEEGQPHGWYMIGDLFDDRLDWARILQVDGIDLITARQPVSELLFAVRTPAALKRLGELLCEGVPPEHRVSVYYYEELISVLLPFRYDRLSPPPSPTPRCIYRTDRPPPPGHLDIDGGDDPL